MRKDTKNTCEIDVINIDGDIEKCLIPSLEYLKKELLRVSMIPFSYFDTRNYTRKRKINKIINKWD